MRLIAILCLFCLCMPAVFATDAPASYTSQCASCHGDDGRGKAKTNFKAPDLHSKAVQDLSDDELYETIARGAKHHDYPHAFLYRGMKEKDIRELVKYIRTIGSAAK